MTEDVITCSNLIGLVRFINYLTDYLRAIVTNLETDGYMYLSIYGC